MGWSSTATSGTSANSTQFALDGNIYIRFGPPPPVRQHPKPAMHPCAVLGVPCKAPLLQVKAAYRRLAKLHHPDLGGDKEKMALLNRAYAALMGAKGD